VAGKDTRGRRVSSRKPFEVGWILPERKMQASDNLQLQAFRDTYSGWMV
jgi:hypothetical protein